jgi:hypothetical protein
MPVWQPWTIDGRHSASRRYRSPLTEELIGVSTTNSLPHRRRTSGQFARREGGRTSTIFSLIYSSMGIGQVPIGDGLAINLSQGGIGIHGS